ncbi:MAG: hypothetical protein WB777_10100, partial [Mycobacterium sp.]
MDLTVGDIDRWSAAAVHEVFLAAGARGRATLDAARQLSSTTLDDTWAGAKAEARQHTTTSIRDDLEEHGSQSLAVARAAGAAADGIAQLQARLATLRHDAAELDLTIDSQTNTVVPRSTLSDQLQFRLDAIVAEANSADEELASAIATADRGPHNHPPQIRRALSTPLPDDPRQFNALWNQLTPDEKDGLFRRDHSIGNRAGMPWDPPDHLGKDHYNRLHLAELEHRTESDIDRMRGAIAELLTGHNGDDGVLYALQSQLAAATTQLEGYRALTAQLNSGGGPKRYLGVLDGFGHGAVSLGNPDTAVRNAVFVPGTGQNLSRLSFSDEVALATYTAARTADGGLTPTDV